MADITLNQLRAIAPHAPEDALVPLNEAMNEAAIDSPRRQAAFLAQMAHESNEFRELTESGDGLRYEGRHDLGNTVQGDGPRFKGRGYVQLTGRRNYTRASGVLGVDLVTHPEMASTPTIAARVAAWYWTTINGNALAGAGDFSAITRAINGGMNGEDSREKYYARACNVFGIVGACE